MFQHISFWFLKPWLPPSTINAFLPFIKIDYCFNLYLIFIQLPYFIRALSYHYCTIYINFFKVVYDILTRANNIYHLYWGITSNICLLRSPDAQPIYWRAHYTIPNNIFLYSPFFIFLRCKNIEPKIFFFSLTSANNKFFTWKHAYYYYYCRHLILGPSLSSKSVLFFFLSLTPIY